MKDHSSSPTTTNDKTMNFRQNVEVSWAFPEMAGPSVMACTDELSSLGADPSTLPYPSPPHSSPSMDKRNLVKKEEEFVISLSTTFHPGNPIISSPPDLILASNDGVLFYLNSRLLASSGFNVPTILSPLQAPFNLDMLPNNQESIVKLPDSSLTLSIIFHAIYNISCGPFSPSLDAISHAISRMTEYSLTPSSLIQAGTHLYVYLMANYAPFSPLDVYVIAAKHRIEPLAVDVSSHLLGLNLSKITDDLASAMGSSYLRRLFFMHQGRMERLKKILIKPPSFHDDVVADCDNKKQAALKRQWALRVTSIVWEAKPDISPFAIQQNLRLAEGVTPCSQCQASWADRVKEVGTEWATVKFTI
ncbi:hypothetical protein BKA70DRAFT_1268143 [Coprinopsis sp. MPI-PUGE-AT-0042]|nr:hypothetical protein BKA70DRAFT_1268143 [Coprinopsis sp. MPI-PUGE-AT-0042]